MNDADLTTGPEAAWANLIAFLPWLLLAVGILVAGYFINMAPAITNGLFQAALAAVAGSAFVVMGGSVIGPIGAQRKIFPDRSEPEEPEWCKRMERIPDQARERTETWKQETQTSVRPGASRTAVKAVLPARQQTRKFNTRKDSYDIVQKS